MSQVLAAAIAWRAPAILLCATTLSTVGTASVDDDNWTAADAAEALLAYAISIAENGPTTVTKHEYQAAHRRLFEDPTARRVADKKLVRFKNPDLMWGHLRSVATGPGSWALRRGAAHELIDPVIDALIDTTESPTDQLVTGATVRLNADSVRDAWDKAIGRRENDPNGAITMARTMLESTLKTILADRGISYKDSDDLPTLYTVRDATRPTGPFRPDAACLLCHGGPAARRDRDRGRSR